MKSILTTLLMLVSSVAIAEPQAGFEYQQTQQAIPTDNPAKVEVTELFWYGCPHCYQLEPSLAVWVKKLPRDVEFKRMPGIPRPDWAPGAKAYYTLEALGLLDKLHGPFFEAIHKQKSIKPNDDAAIIDWIAKQSGLDRKKVDETYNSFSVNTRNMRAMQVFRASGATGVPTLIVDGKYISSISMAGGIQELLKVADQLIERARAEKAGKR